LTFSERFIRRPVLSTVVAFLILLLGAQGIANVGIRQYPEVKETVITVTTTYVGASADLIQGFITTPIAQAVSGAEGVDYVTSSSALSASTVQVHMRLNTDPNNAMTDVSAKVNQVRSQLPPDAQDPVITKGTGQQFAIQYLAVTSDAMNAQQVTEYLTRVVQPRLSTIDGVASADILGGRTFAMRVWIDPVRLASRGATATDIYNAIQNANFLSAPGKTKNELVAYSIQMQTTLSTPQTFGALPIRMNGDQVVRLRDVAKVELGPANTDTQVSFNGKEGTFMAINPTPSANPLTTASLVNQELPSIQASMPPGMNIKVVYDSTKFIRASIWDVFVTIGEAVAIVVLVILLFLGSFRAVMVPIVTIPLSLVGICFGLYALDFSLNTLTLLAMVLAIGLVVDDAIVVVENIHRHIEDGMAPIPAAIQGMKEIFTPVITMTITLAAVYAPIGFTPGLTGALFREFAFTLAGAVIISGFIAVTLSPMMAARLLTRTGGRFQHYVDARFEGLARWYRRRLASTLKYRPVTLLVVAALLSTAGFLFFHTSSELAPQEDQGALFAVMTGPQYATTGYMGLYGHEFDQFTAGIKEVDTRFQIVGYPSTNGGFAVWVLKPWDERVRGQQLIQQEIQGDINKSAGVQAFVFAPPSLPGTGGGLPIQYVVQSIGSASQVYEVAERIRQKAQASGKFIIVQNSLSYSSPQASLTIDRDKAAALGVPISSIGQTITVLVGGNRIAQFNRDSRSYDIIPQVPQRYRLNPEDLVGYFVRSASGAMVPLSSLVKVSTDAAPASIEQFNQLNSATISALPLPTVTTGQGLATIEQVAQEVMPQDFHHDYEGQSRLEKTAGNTILIAFGLAIIVIYLVLAAQFESFRDPFIIMMSVPLSVFGALVFLNLGFGTLNIYTEVGIITLVGLITKHGILMVEFANQVRESRGLNKHDAIVEAAAVRLRPILMTTAAMVLGVVPLIIATGAGAAARYSIGLVIATGMSIGTIFTLFVVPMFYTYVAPEQITATHSMGEKTVPAE
jgi:multidrug efflux pump